MSGATVTPETAATVGLTATSIFYFLLVPALVLWYVYYRLSNRKFYDLAEKIPGPAGLPFLGNALDFIGEAPDIFKKLYSKADEFDTIMKVWIGTKLVVFIADPRDIEVRSHPPFISVKILNEM